MLSAGSTVIAGLLLAAAANSQASYSTTSAAMPSPYAPRDMSSSAPTGQPMTTDASLAAPVTPQPTSFQTSFWESLALEPKDAWAILRDSFKWQDTPLPPEAQARVDEWIDFYSSSPTHLAEVTERSSMWLAWIAQQVSSRQLPGEIALIPFVESSFDPAARSNRGAAGLWQFMPGTGDAMGLVRNGTYDGRLDVITSTQAALDYIELQAEQWYDGNLQLSLAAYNAGAGTVNRARHSAQAQGLAGDYWQLSLPNETMQYLPKLYAIAAIIDDPARYNVSLPEVHTEPAFAKVQLDHSVTLAQASALLEVSQASLAELNPGLLNGAIDPRNVQTLLVPEEVDSDVLAQLAQGESTLSSSPSYANAASAANTAPSIPETYRVARGDNLSAIAARYGVAVDDLMQWNGIERANALQTGQLLTLSAQ